MVMMVKRMLLLISSDDVVDVDAKEKS